jgi:hypothetical protein
MKQAQALATLPMVIISPQKFSLTYSLGSLLILSRYVANGGSSALNELFF